jgi:putative sterol carrier protein
MVSAYVPEGARGFTGELQYDLLRADGHVAHWTVAIAPDRASARPGAAVDPRLTLKLTVADFVRMAGRDLDPGKALLSGRLELQGDFVVALSLAEMFGRPQAI